MKTNIRWADRFTLTAENEDDVTILTRLAEQINGEPLETKIHSMSVDRVIVAWGDGVKFYNKRCKRIPLKNDVDEIDDEEEGPQ